MKKYQAPEFNVIKIAEMGDIIRTSPVAFQEQGFGDERVWGSPNVN